jgi:hypothetical protein
MNHFDLTGTLPPISRIRVRCGQSQVHSIGFNANIIFRWNGGVIDHELTSDLDDRIHSRDVLEPGSTKTYSTHTFARHLGVNESISISDSTWYTAAIT